MPRNASKKIVASSTSSSIKRNFIESSITSTPLRSKQYDQSNTQTCFFTSHSYSHSSNNRPRKTGHHRGIKALGYVQLWNKLYTISTRRRCGDQTSCIAAMTMRSSACCYSPEGEEIFVAFLAVANLQRNGHSKPFGTQPFHSCTLKSLRHNFYRNTCAAFDLPAR